MATRRKATKKARSGGERVAKLENSMEHLEKLVLDIEQRVREHAPAAGTKLVKAVERRLNEKGLSLKDAAPPTMTTPTRRTVMERLAELEAAEQLAEQSRQQFAAAVEGDFDELSERVQKLEAALGEV